MRKTTKREALTDRMVIASERTGLVLERMAELLALAHDEAKRANENLELFVKRGPGGVLAESQRISDALAASLAKVPEEHPVTAGAPSAVTADFLAKVERWGAAITKALASWETLVTAEETAEDRKALEESYHGRSMKALLEAFNS